MTYSIVSGSFGFQVFNQAAPSLSVNVGSGQDRLLKVWMLVRGPAVTISSATYAGVDLQVIGSHAHPSANLSVHAFHLPAPAANSNTLAITPSATSGRQFIVHYAAAVGADQDAPLDDFGFADGTSAAPAVTLDPTEDGELLLGAVLHEGSTANTTGGGETSLGDPDHGAYVSSASYAIQTTAAQQVMNWSNPASDTWVAAAASFKVAAEANTPPAVALDTPDEAAFSTSQPTLLFTGTDADGDDVRYEVEITDDPAFAVVGGSNLTDYLNAGADFNIHPNPSSALTWQGEFQVDDRPGQSFTAAGGVLDKIRLLLADMAAWSADRSGNAVVRVYTHQGTFGASSEPLNPADPADTPTPDWIAESDLVFLDGDSTDGWYDFNFSGENRIRLDAGQHYVLIADWMPDTSVYDNTFAFKAVSTDPHDGNLYNDGASVANNGVQAGWDLKFELYESFVHLDKVSGTDAGFANVDTPADTDPFTSGEQASSTVQSGDELPDGMYYWRARGQDPSGSATWGDWSGARSFSVEVSAGGGITLAATMGATSGTPETASLAVARVFSSALLSTSNTPAAALSVTRPLAASLDAASDTPDAVPLAVGRALAAAMIGQTNTPPVPLAVLRQMDAGFALVSATPDTVVLAVAGAVLLAAVMGAASDTPDAVPLAVGRALAAAMEATGQTGSAELRLMLSLSGEMVAVSSGPDNVVLAVSRSLSAGMEATGETGDISLLVVRLFVGVMHASSLTPDVVSLLVGDLELAEALFRGMARGHNRKMR